MLDPNILMEDLRSRAEAAAKIETTNIEMVQVPAGNFMMGSPVGEPDRDDDEGPQRLVTLNGFYMGKYPVTQAQYQAVTGVNPSHFNTANGRPPAAGDTDGRRPVEAVTWYDAVEFCNMLSVREGFTPVYTISGRIPGSGNPITSATVTADWNADGYRLPTEAEWEYACRAGTVTAFNTGNTVSDSTGWYGGNSGERTHEVGKKPHNAWGLYDMHGNVFEWCWDWYGGLYYGESGNTNNPAGPAYGSSRMFRGGSCMNAGDNLRSAYRLCDNPGSRFFNVGFRVVRK